MLLLAYNVFLVDGLQHRAGYAPFGLFGAVVMVLATLISARGQHSRVAFYPATRPLRFTWSGAFREIVEAFSERAFLILAAGAVAAYVSQGMTFALSNYLYYYVWELSKNALKLYPFVLLISVIIVFTALGPLHRRFGKRRTASVATLGSMTLWLVPYGLRLAGLWPEVGSETSTALLMVFILASNCMGVMVLVSASSMVADIVEAFEMRSGRRAEGSFYSGNWFVQKCSTGFGILISGIIISLSGFPTHANPGTIASPIIDSLIAMYCAVVLVLGLTSAFWLRRFPIERADHEARLAALDAAALADPDATGAHP